jgi:uncharacterized membrane protein YraQ (UPF0718 family)
VAASGGSPPSGRADGSRLIPLGLSLPGRLNELVVVFVSIVLQSQPFVLLGVFASALVQRYLSAERLARWLPRGRLSVVLLASGFGFVAPVCDCGVIPLARRLGAKGLPLYAATTFILAAPVVNPVVLASTAVAFQGDWTIVGLRMAMSLSVAVTVGLLAAALMPAAPLLSVSGPANAADRRGGALADIFEHAVAEYFDIALFIVLGALFTAVTQTFVPRGDLVALGSSRIGSVAALMPVATLLSICSEADAFVARAFAATFSTGALLAFMTIGQIVDLRNGLLLFRTLPTRLVALIVVVAYGLIFVESLAVNGVLLSP